MFGWGQGYYFFVVRAFKYVGWSGIIMCGIARIVNEKRGSTFIRHLSFTVMLAYFKQPHWIFNKSISNSIYLNPFSQTWTTKQTSLIPFPNYDYDYDYFVLNKNN